VASAPWNFKLTHYPPALTDFGTLQRTVSRGVPRSGQARPWRSWPHGWRCRSRRRGGAGLWVPWAFAVTSAPPWPSPTPLGCHLLFFVHQQLCQQTLHAHCHPALWRPRGKADPALGGAYTATTARADILVPSSCLPPSASRDAPQEGYLKVFKFQTETLPFLYFDLL
jgi:hypothetical protein